jgi:hypothetical protein
VSLQDDVCCPEDTCWVFCVVCTRFRGGGDGGTVGSGSRATGMKGSRAAAAAGGAPAGDDEHLYATGQKGEMVK